MKKTETKVLVVTAVALSAAQRKHLASEVQKRTGAKSVTLDERVDPDVIGGIRLIVDDVEYDATIRSKLSQLSQQMKASLS